MRNHQRLMMTLTIALLAGFTTLLGGCEREIGHTERTEIKNDGTVKTEEKTVTEGPGNRTTVTETRTTDRPGDADDPD
jgi:hypothetical protein